VRKGDGEGGRRPPALGLGKFCANPRPAESKSETTNDDDTEMGWQSHTLRSKCAEEYRCPRPPRLGPETTVAADRLHFAILHLLTGSKRSEVSSLALLQVLACSCCQDGSYNTKRLRDLRVCCLAFDPVCATFLPLKSKVDA